MARTITGALVVLLVVVSSACEAGQPVGIDDVRSEEPAWSYLTRSLERAGVASDTESLIHAARNHEEVVIRAEAVELLGRRQEKEAREALRSIYATDQQGSVREQAALALMRMGDAEGSELVRELMWNELSKSHQLYLASELAHANDYSGYILVVTAAGSEESRVRSLSARGLGHFIRLGFDGGQRGPAPVVLLRELLRDTEAEVRGAALREVSALAQLGGSVEHFTRHIEKMAESDPEKEIRERAQRILVVMEVFGHDKNEEPIPR